MKVKIFWYDARYPVRPPNLEVFQKENEKTEEQVKACADAFRKELVRGSNQRYIIKKLNESTGDWETIPW